MSMFEFRIPAAALLAVSVVAGVAACPLLAQEKPAAPAAKHRAGEQKGLSLAEFEKLHKELHITTEPWTTIPWQVSLTEARQLAAKDKKPLFVFVGNGHLLDCG